MDELRGRAPQSASGEAYSGAWLAAKLGVEPRELDVRRRSGELLGVPVGPGTEYLYPAWQFDPAGQPLPAIARVVAAAREAGLGETELADLLWRRDGMMGSTRLLDALRAGREEPVIAEIRRARRRG
ncbi:MAG: hypothetical protein M3327_00410 [Actinomycetota bacterium]|nr:hypothetical protein [Actinomycetota bacterium]